MGNCQAIDNASIAIQHASGRVGKLYSSVPASHILKSNPSHYVALLLTTTTTSAATTGSPLRITHIKLLRPSDILLLGHTYILISAQEVMKELLAKKHAKMQKKQTEEHISSLLYSRAFRKDLSQTFTGFARSGRDEKTNLDSEHQNIIKHKNLLTRKLHNGNIQVTKYDRHRPRKCSSTNCATARLRWHPSLNSISESSS
ncbi:hypothetical protein POM88_044175 [Heracleum sosnowskyi]|uniref:Uncharacterized protein n=1 Tax=Heracleum sosnowskyi TaxID=360622 RepID=A0AAD8M3Q7_9APIA|nr:hypothetical protein POM88_044175 [Heracleum sosnowskyi]